MPLALSLENLASQAALDAHIADTTAAHAASAIAFTPTGSIAATDVQAALAEVASEAGGGTPGVDYPTKATVTLSSADILDLHNTPVTLVAAPGAGKWLMVHRIAEYLSFGTVAYTVGGNQPIVNYAGEPTELVGCTTLDSGEDATQSSPALNVYVLASAAVNKALVLFVDGAGLTDGDGTLTVTVWYTIEDVPA